LKSSQLKIFYRLSGDLSQIAIPRGLHRPGRRDRLWQQTCFEFFLAKQTSRKYFEWNLSPSLNWNSYGFRSYRLRNAEFKFLEVPRVETKRGVSSLQLSCSLDLSNLFSEPGPLDLGFSAVLLHRGGFCSYWALQHSGKRPDFHLRKNFSLSLNYSLPKRSSRRTLR
jgi:hypothetical protein